MTTILNASTSAGLIITPDTSGNIQLQYNGVAAPAFSAYKTSNQNISQTTWTTVIYEAEDFDTAGCFNTSNGRFTPNVAGYYALSFNLENSTNVTGFVHTMFFKNGSYYTRGSAGNCSSQQAICSGSVVMYLNGTTDYANIGVFASMSGFSLDNPSFANRFSGCLLRGA